MTQRFAVPAEKVPAVAGRSLLFIEGKAVALLNIASQLYAFEDSCPHQGASLYAGRLEGQVIQCCAHGLRFDLSSGYLVNSTHLKLTTYPVEVLDDQVFIIMDGGDEQYGRL